MALLQQFKEFLRLHDLIPDVPTPTLLAVSGGLDSVVMAHLFRFAGLPFAIAHCNFQLRDTASDEDATFVSRLADASAAPFFVKRFDTKVYALANRLSTQVAARELRYAWFAELCAEHGFAQIATAHHLNDSAETLVLQLARGTGIKGLRGIPLKNAQVIRPLLFATREAILAFARENRLEWREDSSNASDQYTRNYIRHQVIPLLQEINPDFLHSTQKTMRRMGELEQITGFLLEEWFKANSRTESDGTLKLSLSILAEIPHAPHFLFLLLEKKGFTPEQCRQLSEGLEKQPGLEISAEEYRALIDRNDLIVTPLAAKNPEIQIHADDLMVRLPGGKRLMSMPATPAPPYPDGRTEILVDAEKLVFPLTVRGWQPGDAFQPFGMGGKTQKLQDFLTNLKLSRIEKEQVLLLVNGNGAIICILGYRMDERFKIEKTTNNALKVSML